jgi:hypothetical protein
VARDLERRVLEVLGKGLRRRIYAGRTPPWLLRPGREEIASAWPLLRRIYRELTGGLELPAVMPLRESRTIDGVLGGRGLPQRVVEIDESQHFNAFRGATLRAYPQNMRLGFPRELWLELSLNGRMTASGGWAAPKPPLFPMNGGRHRQRAFRDALADLLPREHGWAPTLRIADVEVAGWIWDSRGAPSRLARLVEERLA